MPRGYPGSGAAAKQAAPVHHTKKRDVEAEQLIKWAAIALLTAGLVIVLMKGMLALAVYLIKTLPISMVS